MVEIKWTRNALEDLDGIAKYISREINFPTFSIKNWWSLTLNKVKKSGRVINVVILRVSLSSRVIPFNLIE